MILDQQQMFSGTDVAGVLTGQVVPTGAAVASTNVIDQLAARVLGSGQDIELLTEFSATVGAVTTMQAQLIGADDAAMTINRVVLADTGVSAAFAAGSSGLLRAAVKVAKPKRFLRVEYTVAGAASQATFISGLALSEQTTLDTIL